MIQHGECRKTVLYLYAKRLRYWKDNVNVIFPDDEKDSVISVISVWHVDSVLIQPGEHRSTI